MRAACSPVAGGGIINQQLAGGICLFTPLLGLLQLFSLHVSICRVLACTTCAAYIAYTCHTMSYVMPAMLL